VESAGTVLSGCAGGGSALIRPGKKKVAGEMLLLALMPLQPAQMTSANKQNVNRRFFEFSITEFQV